MRDGPGIFLSVAAFIINIVLSRLVATQRDQVAVLKAFGYSNRSVCWHYLKLALAAVLLGVALAVPLAAWLGGQLVQIYRDFFHFPRLAWSISPAGFALAAGISLAAAFGGAFVAVRHAVRLPPAEAMRPEPPARFRPTVIERLGFQRWLSVATRMIVRMALATRPPRPITQPLSSGCTVSRNTVPLAPRYWRTLTASGWSTNPLAMNSTSSLICRSPSGPLSCRP